MDQTNKEEFWNTLTHFAGIIFTLVGLPFIVTQNSALTKIELFSVLFFQFGLLFMYTSSTLYHYVQNFRIKKILRVVDHISIYYLIAGSYAPICLITLLDHSSFLKSKNSEFFKSLASTQHALKIFKFS